MRRKLMIAAFACGCAEEAQVKQEIVRPVRFVSAVSTGAGRARAFSGTAQAGMSSTLSFKVSGTIDQLPIEVGSKVDEGQLIARLDPTDHQLQVQQSQAALSQASAQLRNARAQYDRTRALYENDNASRAELDTARSGFETAQAQVSSARKRLALARRQLDYTSLTAPAKGSIAQVMVEQNENVSPGGPVATLSSGDAPEVKIDVPEVLISQVVEDLEVTVRFDAIDGRTFRARIAEVGVAPGRGSTTYPVIARLEESDPAIRPGLAAEVEVVFGGESQGDVERRFLLPPSAVGKDEQGTFVFVVEPTEPGFGKVHRKAVEVGDLTSDGLEVTNGIDDGQRVVTAGVSKIRDGQRVRLPAS